MQFGPNGNTVMNCFRMTVGIKTLPMKAALPIGPRLYAIAMGILRKFPIFSPPPLILRLFKFNGRHQSIPLAINRSYTTKNEDVVPNILNPVNHPHNQNETPAHKSPPTPPATLNSQTESNIPVSPALFILIEVHFAKKRVRKIQTLCDFIAMALTN